MIYYQDKDLTVRAMYPSDCQAFHQGFAAQGWDKPFSQFERYFEEQREGVKKVLVAVLQGEVAGYTTLLPQAPAGPFAGMGWPEVCDFNVLEKFQRRGIGSRILAVAEDLASRDQRHHLPGGGIAQRVRRRPAAVCEAGLYVRWLRPMVPGQAPGTVCPLRRGRRLGTLPFQKLVRREFRPLTREEIAPELFRCFDRFQIVEKCWRKVEGQWVVKDVVFTERWGEEDYRFLCQCLQNTVATGGQVWGAFLEGRLKGFASVEGPLIGSQKQYADLTSIHVSADARGHGLGRQLFQRAEETGRRLGAKALYISAHSSVESQAFYKAMGCVEATEYIPAHVEQEPCDCQLECPL